MPRVRALPFKRQCLRLAFVFTQAKVTAYVNIYVYTPLDIITPQNKYSTNNDEKSHVRSLYP